MHLLFSKGLTKLKRCFKETLSSLGHCIADLRALGMVFFDLDLV